MNASPRYRRLRISRLIHAPRQRVFDAFVVPALRRRWWFPEEGMRSDHCEIDPRPGGRYRVSMNDDRSEEPKEFVCEGEFLELEEPARLVFTWIWEHERKPGVCEEEITTTVTVELHEADCGTEVVILHEEFRDEAEGKGYAQGWEGCLENLERALGQDSRRELP